MSITPRNLWYCKEGKNTLMNRRHTLSSIKWPKPLEFIHFPRTMDFWEATVATHRHKHTKHRPLELNRPTGLLVFHHVLLTDDEGIPPGNPLPNNTPVSSCARNTSSTWQLLWLLCSSQPSIKKTKYD